MVAANLSRKKSRLALLALEPRLLFDGALAVSDPQVGDSHLNPLLVLPDSSVASISPADHSDLDPAALASVLPGTGHELVVIDGAIYNAQTLIDDVRQDPSRTVLVLNPAGNEESQLTEFLGQHPGEFDAIHLMTHGVNGWLFLGTQALYLGDIMGHAALWSSVGASLTPGGDLLLYGCKTAGVDATSEFIDQLAQFTGADIAASIDTTGSGGNWALEHRVGNVQATELQPASWQGDLAVALAVSNPSVSEASPFVMFTIKGNPSQTVTLTLSGTATGGATSSTAGADYVTTMETSINGATWTAGNIVTLSAGDGEAFVRLRIVNDTFCDNGETITLTATPSSGAAATGTATLHDDGTGYSFDGSLSLPVLDASSLSVSEWHDVNAAKSKLLIGSYHGAFYASELGGYYVAGENASPTGTNLTTPVLVNPANGYTYTGDIIDVSVTGLSGKSQYLLLTTEGLWTWGLNGTTIEAASRNFAPVSLPSNFVPSQVKSMSASDVHVSFLMQDGTVRTAGLSNTVYPNGLPTGAADYGQVRLNDATNSVLTGISDLVQGTANAFAYSRSDNKFYTWGGDPYLGDGNTNQKQQFATVMTNPLPTGVDVIQLEYTNNTYYVLGSNKQIYVLGYNIYGQAGQGNNQDLRTWTTVKNSAGTAPLTNVQYISANSNAPAESSVGAILNDGSIRMWGTNSSGMLGTLTAGNNKLPTVPTGVIASEDIYVLNVAGHYSVALRYGCDGTIFASGHNPGGAFGDGSVTSRTEFAVNMFLGNIAGACEGPQSTSVIGTNLADDDRPSYSINDVTVDEATGTMTFTVTKTGATTVTSTVNYATATDSAVAADFTAISGTLSFAANETSKTITVSITNDSAFETTEQFFLNLSSPTNAKISDAQGVGTITDLSDIGAGTNPLVNNVTVNEGSPYAVFTVTGKAGAGVTLVMGTTATATDVDTAAADFVGTGFEYYDPTFNGTGGWRTYTAAVTIPAGNNLLVRRAINNDSTFEGPETFTLKATYNGTGGGTNGGTSTGICTIVDDGTGSLFSSNNTTGSADSAGDATSGGVLALNDDRPAFTINDVSVNESAGTMTFTVTKTGSTNLSSTVTYATSDGTATAGADYIAKTGTLTFAAGVTTQTITIPITNDTIYEDIETLNVVLSGASNATIADSTGVGSILIDPLDIGSNPLVNSITVNEGSPYLVFTVTGKVGAGATLALGNTASASDVDATLGTDTAATSSLEVYRNGAWVAYSSANSIINSDGKLLARLAVTQDNLLETAETLTLTATYNNAGITSGVTVGGTSIGTATIRDDGTGNLYSASNTTGSSEAAGTNGLPASLDNDGPNFTISDVVVNEATGTMTFTIFKNGALSQASTVDYATSDGTATVAGSDYVAASGTLSFAVGESSKTVTISIGNQSALEGAESFYLNLSNATNASINDSQGVATIRDDGTGKLMVGGALVDPVATSTVTPGAGVALADDDRALSVGDITVNEGSYAVFTVTGAVGQYVKLSLADGTALKDIDGTPVLDGTEDYGPALQYWDGAAWQTYAAGDFIKLPNGGTTLKVRTAIVNDTVSDNGQTFTLNATNTGNVAATGTATIKDDGTGSMWDANGVIATPSSAAVVNPGSALLANDDRSLTVNNITVNEASPYATFTVSGAANQYVKLSLGNTAAGGDVDASLGTDTGTTLQYFDGSAWADYTSGTYVKMGASGALQVRVVVNNDTASEGAETIQLTAYNTQGVANVAAGNGDTGIGTIVDNGSGTVYAYTSNTTDTPIAQPAASTLDDDRALTVTGSTVNEASPYLVFSVAGATGQYVKLSLADSTATGGLVDNSIVDGTVDYGASFEYFNGTSWASYTSNSFVQIPAGGSTLLVRTAVQNDTPYEMAETLVLMANNTGGGGANGTGTIVDNGTGVVYLSTNNTAIANNSGDAGYPVLNDDRYNNPAFVNNVQVNEGSAYVVFNVSGVPLANVALTVTDVTATGGSAANADGSVDYDNVASHLEYFDPIANLWQAYDPSNPPQLSVGAGELLVRIPIFQDDALDGGEQFKLSVQYPTAQSVVPSGSLTQTIYDGYAIIKDDGTGSQWSFDLSNPADTGTQTTSPADGSPGLGFDDDRPVTVNNVSVNESSPYVVFTVTAKEGQYVKLSLSDTTAQAADHGSTLEYWNGTAWTTYAANSFVQVPSDGDTTAAESSNLLVRVAITNDIASDNAETIKLTAYNASGFANAADSNGHTGIATIMDDGTGSVFTTSSGVNGGGVSIGSNPSPGFVAQVATPASASVVDPSTSALPLLNDDRSLTVNNITVNEGSPYATFTVSGAADQYAKLSLGNTTAGGDVDASLGTDTGTTLQYFDGTAWADYTSGTYVKMGASGTLQVRVVVNNDTASEGAETIQLTAYNTQGAANVAAGNGDNGIGTIVDDGSGTVYAYSSNSTATPSASPAASALDDDRSLTVNNITVNESSPYATFTVSGAADQYVKLSLGNTTTGGDVDASLGTDTGTTLQYFDGTAWADYTSGTYVKMDASGTLQVRVVVNNDTASEGAETIQLTAYNTQGVGNVAAGNGDTGIGTIVDNGSGTVYAYASNSTATANAQPAASALDDDRALTVTGSTVNEASPYLVFSVAGAPGQYVKLSLADSTAKGGVVNNGAGGTVNGTVDYSSSFEYFNGTSWASYTPNSFVQIPAGGSTLLVRTAVQNDTPYELSEDFVLTALNTAGASASATGVITDDGTGSIYLASNNTFIANDPADTGFPALNDDRPTVSISSVSVSEATDQYAVVQLSLSAASSLPITVNPVLVSGGSNPATLFVDTASTPSGNDLEYSVDGLTWLGADAGITFAPGQTSVQLRSAIVMNDGITENPETYLIQAGAVTGTVTINDFPSMSISNVSVNEASPKAVVELSFSSSASLPVAFTPSLISGTATAALDTGTTIEYLDTTSGQWATASTFDGTNWVGGMTVPAGATSVLLRISIAADVLNEVSESLSITTGTATNVLNTGGVTGTITIFDQGTDATSANNSVFGVDNTTNTPDQLTAASSDVVDPLNVTAGEVLLDDDRPLTVDNLTVNEGSPYVVFTVSAKEGQYVSLSLAAGTASAGTDYANAMEYWNGSAWTAYTVGTFVAVPADGDANANEAANLLVRVAIKQDTLSDNGETFTLTATNTGGTSASGTCTIADDGSGDVYVSRIDDPATVANEATTGVTASTASAPATADKLTPASALVVERSALARPDLLRDDDRPVLVNDIVVNEGSPYVVWTVSAKTGQYVRLEAASGTAVLGSDTGLNLEWFDGNAWHLYTDGTFVTVPGVPLSVDGQLLIRMQVINDRIFEDTETLSLTAYNTQGQANFADANGQGIATIRDDGKGDLYLDSNMTGLPDPVGSLKGPKYLDDDRVVTPLNVTYPLPLNFIAETERASTNRSLHVLGAVAESRSLVAMLDTQAVSRSVVAAAAGALADSVAEQHTASQLIAKFERITDPALHVQMAVDASRQQSNEQTYLAYTRQSGLLLETSLIRDSSPAASNTSSRGGPSSMADQTLANLQADRAQTDDGLQEMTSGGDAYLQTALSSEDAPWQSLRTFQRELTAGAPAQRGQLNFSKQLQSFANKRTVMREKAQI